MQCHSDFLNHCYIFAALPGLEPGQALSVIGARNLGFSN